MTLAQLGKHLFNQHFKDFKLLFSQISSCVKEMKRKESTTLITTDINRN